MLNHRPHNVAFVHRCSTFWNKLLRCPDVKQGVAPTFFGWGGGGSNDPQRDTLPSTPSHPTPCSPTGCAQDQRHDKQLSWGRKSRRSLTEGDTPPPPPLHPCFFHLPDSDRLPLLLLQMGQVCVLGGGGDCTAASSTQVLVGMVNPTTKWRRTITPLFF